MKAFAKNLLGGLCKAMVLPVLGLYHLARLLAGPERAFMGVSQSASRWSGVVGQYLRAALLRSLVRRLGRDVVISFGSILTKREAELDDGVYVGAYCLLGQVHVGRDTLIADRVCIPSGSGQHGIDRLDIPIRQQEGQFKTVRIGQDCWIGSGSIVLADVGDHSVVAAGSVVVHPVGEYQIVAGNPAKVIGDRRTRGAGAEPAPPPAALPVNTIGQA